MTKAQLSESLKQAGIDADLKDLIEQADESILQTVENLQQMENWENHSEVSRQALLLAALLKPVVKEAKEQSDAIRDGVPNYVEKAQNRARKLLWKKGFNNTRRDVRELAVRLASLSNVLDWSDSQQAKDRLALMLLDQKLLKEWDADLIRDYLLAALPERAEETEKLIEDLKTRKASTKIQEIPAQEDHRPEVIMLSGLPASGKDTLIAREYPDLDVVSLDQIRLDTGISPVGDQSEVVRIGKEKARKLLEEGKPFIWNATSLTKRLRKQQYDLFSGLGARVKIVYLETDFNRLLERNEKREATVPEEAIERMMNIIDPPHVWEADEVEWILT